MISTPFREPAHALGHGHAEDGELLGAVAEPHAQHEPAAGEHVEEGADLRDLDGVVQRQEHEVGAEGEALGLGGEALQHGQEREVVEARRRVVLAAPDRVEAERADEARLLERLREAARGIVAGGVLRVEIDAELHAPRPQSLCQYAAPFEADDAPEAGRLEVPGGDQDLLALEAVEEGAARLAGEVRIHVGARDPVGILHLHRAVGGIAQDERALALRGDEKAHVAGRVARRRHRR